MKKMTMAEFIEEIESAYKDWAVDHFQNHGFFPDSFIFYGEGFEEGSELDLSEQWCQAQREKHNFYGLLPDAKEVTE